MIVIKFGGTSVGDADRVATAIDIVGGRAALRPIVVVSALSGVTNELVAATKLAANGDQNAVNASVDRIRARHEEVALRLVKQKSDYFESFLAQLHRHVDQIAAILKGIALVGDVSPRATDKIVAIGEKLSSVLFAYSMRLRTLPGVHVDSEQVVVTDDQFGQAVPIMEETRKRAGQVLLPEIERNHIPVMGGFIGRSLSGATTTLGRGGSDYSASIIGAAVDADEIQIWTDVDGMMTCDPRLISSARIIDEISYDEAAELAYFGAKVLHPKTIEPAVDRRIPIRVLNTHNLDSPGTLITHQRRGAAGPLAIALKKGITVIHITSNQMLGAHGFLARIFEVFDRLKIPVDLITTSEVSVSLTIDDAGNVDALGEALGPIAHTTVDRQMAIIALVGRQVMKDLKVGARIFEALEGTEIAMMTMGSSDLNVSIVLPETHADRAVRSLHQALFERSAAEVA
jgi:aspartate kinase